MRAKWLMVDLTAPDHAELNHCTCKKPQSRGQGIIWEVIYMHCVWLYHEPSDTWHTPETEFWPREIGYSLLYIHGKKLSIHAWQDVINKFMVRSNQTYCPDCECVILNQYNVSNVMHNLSYLQYRTSVTCCQWLILQRQTTLSSIIAHVRNLNRGAKGLSGKLYTCTVCDCTMNHQTHDTRRRQSSGRAKSVIHCYTFMVKSYQYMHGKTLSINSW